MTLPDESRDQIGKSQDIWNWLVHPPPTPAYNRVNAGYNSYVQCTYNVNCVYYIHSGGTCGVRYLDRE